jgi:3-oxoacyl-(acyl-carrier-protein) synthase
MQAFTDARAENAIAPERIAHVCAGQNLSLSYYAENLRSFEQHPDDIEPLLGMIALDTDTVGVVCELLNLRGPCSLVGGACASGNLALLSGLDLIRSGRADAVVVTGAPSSFDSMILHAWTMIDALTFQSFNDEPERASRPFDARREGFVPSEGAGAVVLESLASARHRGAKVRAEIVGAAATSDACRLPKPHEEGQVRAMRNALLDAGIGADEIDYVNAHATSTPLGDAVEVGALKTVFGRHAYEIPVNSTKSMIGHCLTSAAVMELVATLLQMEHGMVHPTINQEEPDPALDLDFVPNRARAHRIDKAISNSFGFGGINSSIVVARINE